MKIYLTKELEIFSKNQIKEFEKIEAGGWRYKNVEAWRGVACEIAISNWLSKNFNVTIKAKGLDNSGLIDDFDLKIGSKKIEIKSATKNYFKYIMPKVHDVLKKPKDIYIGAKFNENTHPNEINVIGFLTREKILNYKTEKNKGAPYYKIPINDFLPINLLEDYLV